VLITQTHLLLERGHTYTHTTTQTPKVADAIDHPTHGSATAGMSNKQYNPDGGKTIRPINSYFNSFLSAKG